MSENMEYYASIDASYEVIERAERQRKRLIMFVLGISIPAILGLLINSFFIMVYSHQKGVSNNNLLLMATIIIICIILLGLAIWKISKFLKINKQIRQINKLEETLYNEVLKIQYK